MINPNTGKIIIIISQAQVVEGSFRSINISENEKKILAITIIKPISITICATTFTPFKSFDFVKLILYRQSLQ